MIIIRDEFSISHLFYTLIRMTNNVFTFNTTTIFSLKKNLLTWTLLFNNYGKKQKKNAVLKCSVACASFLSLSLSLCLCLSLCASLSISLFFRNSLRVLIVFLLSQIPLCACWLFSSSLSFSEISRCTLLVVFLLSPCVSQKPPCVC
jgi:hypothetical protein